MGWFLDITQIDSLKYAKIMLQSYAAEHLSILPHFQYANYAFLLELSFLFTKFTFKVVKNLSNTYH